VKSTITMRTPTIEDNWRFRLQVNQRSFENATLALLN
jgi:hypothetical protein